MRGRHESEWAASGEPGDDEVIRWASNHRLRYYYAAEPSLRGRCLKVHLGQVTAYFRSGKLVRLWVQAEGEYLDDVFHQLSRLFELCVQIDGYLDQQAIALLVEPRSLSVE